MQLETYAMDLQVREIKEERTRKKGVHEMRGGIEGVKEGAPSSWYLFRGGPDRPVMTKQRRHSEGSRPNDQVCLFISPYLA